MYSKVWEKLNLENVVDWREIKDGRKELVDIRDFRMFLINMRSREWM